MTSTASALSPTASAMAPLAAPPATADRLVPLPTFTAAPASFAVGVSLAWVAPYGTRRPAHGPSLALGGEERGGGLRRD